MQKYIATLLLIISLFTAQAGKLEKGFDALKIYDYFKAKALFYQCKKKSPAGANFGLASIYVNDKNPFFNLDSARLCLEKSEKAFELTKDKSKLSAVGVTQVSINKLRGDLYSKEFEVVQKQSTIKACERFIKLYPKAPQKEQTTRLMEEIAFRCAVGELNLKNLAAFIKKHPNAVQAERAQFLYDSLVFSGETGDRSMRSYQEYIRKNPQGRYVNKAWDEIWQLLLADTKPGKYEVFLKANPQSPISGKAWLALYDEQVHPLIPERLNLFNKRFPESPLKKKIEEDLVLAAKELFPVAKDGKWGHVDTAGVWVISPDYDWCGTFDKGLAEVEQNGKTGFIDKSRKWMLEPYLDDADAFLSGTAIVSQGDSSGLIDENGRLILPVIFEEIGGYSEGLAACKREQWGYLNAKGDLVIKYAFDSASLFKGGVAVVKQADKYFAIDTKGNSVLADKYDYLSDFEKGLAVFRKENQFGLIDKKGTIVVPGKYVKLTRVDGGFYLFTENGKSGFINPNGHIISTAQFSATAKDQRLAGFFEGLSGIGQQGKYGFIDSLGHVVVKPLYQDARPFSKGLAAVKKDKKWGYIDTKGKVTIPFKFDEADTFFNDLAIVRQNHKASLIDHQGNIISTQAYYDFQLGTNYIIARNAMGYSLFDKRFQPIVSGEFTEIIPEKGFFRLKKGNEEAILYKGKIIWKN